MKVRVVRELVEGRYQVAFQVDDFSAEEVKKMSQFGTPVIALSRHQNGQNIMYNSQVTQIPPFAAAFKSEQAAKDYEASVLERLKDAIEQLRAHTDKFTSVEEIAF